jgi:hypothetical protein
VKWELRKRRGGEGVSDWLNLKLRLGAGLAATAILVRISIQLRQQDEETKDEFAGESMMCNHANAFSAHSLF